MLDHHDRSIKAVAQTLRDAEMEVIYTDYGVPEEIANMAAQEAVDVIGVSFMSGGQVKVTQRLVELMEQKGISDIPLFIGGVIRAFDLPKLQDLGLLGIYRGGDSLAILIDDIRNAVHG